MICNEMMDKYEFRRLAFKKLIESFGDGGQAKVAKAIAKEPSYVNRMLYPAGKPGKKRIGENTVEILSNCFPGWLDIDLDQVNENPFSARAKSERERRIQEIIRLIRETDNQGIEIVLHSATLMYEKFPIAKQTPSSL